MAAHRPALDRYLSVRRNEAWEDDELWGLVGYALRTTGRKKYAADWLADWQRRNVAPWMLLQGALAVREMGDGAAAAAMHRQALSLPEDGSIPSHQLWLAFDAALTGRFSEASGLLSAIAPDSLDRLHEAVYGGARALVDSENVADWKEAARPWLIAIIRVGRQVQPSANTLLRSTYDQVINALKKRHRSIATWFWGEIWRSRLTTSK
jgi:hypothetical protein